VNRFFVVVLACLLGGNLAAQVLPVGEQTEGLTGVARGESRRYAGVNNDFNSVCVNPDDDFCSWVPKDYERAAEGGFGWQRFNLSWALVNAIPNVYDFRTAERAVSEANRNQLSTWMYLSGAPRWTTGGKPWLEPFYCMVKPWDPPEIKAKYNAPPYNGFRADIPECGNASEYPVSREDFERMVRAAVEHFPDVRYWSFGNEFHNPVFWPAGWNQSVEDGHRSAVDQVLRPGYEAAKAADPRTLVVGPDEDSAESLEVFLRQEAEGIARGESPLFDIISIHLYGRIEDVEWALRNSFGPVFDRYGRGRQVWITEFGYQTDPNDPLSEVRQAEWHTRALEIFRREAARDHGGRWNLTKFFVYRLTDGRVPWDPNVDQPGCGIIHHDSTPKEAWYVFRDFIRNHPSPLGRN
jgi:hypothetical protein